MVLPSLLGSATLLPPEVEVLLAAARLRLDGATGDRMRTLVRSNLDWHRLCDLADRHETLGLLYTHLQTICPEAVPPSVLVSLRRQFQEQAAHQLLLTAELLDILPVLAKAGIPALPFKGPTLAASVYGHLALRPFRDVDLLVPQRDVWRVHDLLVARGYYRRIDPVDDPNGDVLRSPCEHHLEMVRAHPACTVEVHWRIAQECFAFPLDFERLWKGRTTVALGTVTVPSVAEEDLLLVLCLHGAKHTWNELKLIVDVAELIRGRPDLDWERVRRQARKLGCQRLLWLGLALAHGLLNAVLPERVGQWIQADHRALPLAREVGRRLLQEPDHQPAALDRWAFFLRTRERLRDRVRCCLGLGEIPAAVDRTILPRTARFGFHLAQALRPNHRDRAWLPLPPALSFLYYVTRPVRLLTRARRPPDRLD